MVAAASLTPHQGPGRKREGEGGVQRSGGPVAAMQREGTGRASSLCLHPGDVPIASTQYGASLAYAIGRCAEGGHLISSPCAAFAADRHLTASGSRLQPLRLYTSPAGPPPYTHRPDNMGSALENLVASIQGLSGSSSDLSSLLSTLKQAESVLRQNTGGLLTAVANLDAAQHSLGAVFLL